MTRLSNSLVLLSILGSLVAASPQQYDQEEQHKDANCDNGCWFKYFTNQCNEDNPACVCTLKERRESYFCCLAQKCDDHVLPDSIERQTDGCIAWKIPFTFDSKAVCGVDLPVSSNTLSDTVPTTSEVLSSSKASKPTVSTATSLSKSTYADALATPVSSPTTSGDSTATRTISDETDPTTVENGASRTSYIWSVAALPFLFCVYL